MPAAYHYSLSWRTDTASTDQKAAILNMSHGVSCLFLERENTENQRIIIQVSVVLVAGAAPVRAARGILIRVHSILRLPGLPILVPYISLRGTNTQERSTPRPPEPPPAQRV
jgi:hypothetical protein